MADYTSSSVLSNPVSAHPDPIQYRHHLHHHSAEATEIHQSTPSPPMSFGSRSEQERSSLDATRPALADRRTNSTMIVPRDTPQIELLHEEYGEDDARSMSPRRSSEEIDRLSENARNALVQQAKELQTSLLQIASRVETIRSEHEKLEGGNKFLQSYIGELMQTSKITSTGASKGKGKGQGK